VGALKVTVDCRVDGPLADGRADAVLRQWRDATVREITQAGRDYIAAEAQTFDRSGRGGTGRAAAGVQAHAAGGEGTITGGIREGEFSWPWLEGTSKRNFTTGFKGYRTFRRTRLRLDREAQAIGERELARVLPLIGGQ
jgi:hypothetical protein